MKENSTVRMLRGLGRNTFLPLPCEGSGTSGLIASSFDRFIESNQEKVVFERFDRRFDPYFEGPFELSIEENTTFVRDLLPAYNGRVFSLHIEGPDSELFEFHEDASLHFKEPADAETPRSSQGTNTYQVAVRIRDKYRQAVQEFTITVIDTDEIFNPFLRASIFSRSENSTVVSTLIAVSNGTVTFSIDPGYDAEKFNLNAITGELAFKVAPDYESPQSSTGTNSYRLNVRMTDPYRSSVQTVTVYVTNISEPTDSYASFICQTSGGDLAGYSSSGVSGAGGLAPYTKPPMGSVDNGRNTTQGIVVRQLAANREGANNRTRLDIVFDGKHTATTMAGYSKIVIPNVGTFSISSAALKAYIHTDTMTLFVFYVSGLVAYSKFSEGSNVRLYLNN